MKGIRFLIAILIQMLVMTPAAFAGDEAILTASGNITNTNTPDKKAYVFSFAELSKLPTTPVRTKTTWTKESTFAGPMLRDILKAVGAKPDAKEIEVQTLDNYPVTIPIADFKKWEVILAHSQDNKRLTISTRGPLWIIYPVDKYPKDLDNNVTRAKFAWAVKGFVVR